MGGERGGLEVPKWLKNLFKSSSQSGEPGSVLLPKCDCFVGSEAVFGLLFPPPAVAGAVIAAFYSRSHKTLLLSPGPDLALYWLGGEGGVCPNPFH